MSLDADHIVDRRRMRRKLTFWRVLTVLVAGAGVAALAYSLVPRAAGLATDYIARIKIQGLIRGDQERVEALDRLGRSTTAKAVIVHVDSPGGTTAGAEQLYDALMRLKSRKPLVVVIDGLAASGGYITALAADHIIAQETSLVGSIGVLFQYPNFTDLLQTIGVKVESIKSSPLKAAPSGFEPTSPEARAAIEAIVRDTYEWFQRLVQSRRSLDQPLLERVSDGRVFTGRQSITLKLIDALGDERAAVDWLVKEKNVATGMPVRDYELAPRFRDLSFLHLAAVTVLQSVGLRTLAQRIEAWGALQAVERLNLDGLLALWHPPISQ
ncbi:MAG: signal peptide peptidase SppA [Rhizobiales bacterium]|nr:signal peptide peptidase SppA [Hyphomicrobiales bacterium]